MTSRAADAERTGDRIVDAMLERFTVLEYANIRLEDVAADAGVTVQTVIRRFGSKAGLMLTTVQRELGAIMANRAAIAGASPRETVEALAQHYEKYGRLILKVYSEASVVEGLPEVAKAGREYHVGWCRSAFAGHLQPLADAQREERRMAEIIAVCDSRTWYILRVDCGLSIDQTTAAIFDLLAPVLATE